MWFFMPCMQTHWHAHIQNRDDGNCHYIFCIQFTNTYRHTCKRHILYFMVNRVRSCCPHWLKTWKWCGLISVFGMRWFLFTGELQLLVPIDHHRFIVAFIVVSFLYLIIFMKHTRTHAYGDVRLYLLSA